MNNIIRRVLLASLVFAFPLFIHAQNASRQIAASYYAFDNDSSRLVNTDSSVYHFNSNVRGINHYINDAAENGYNLGELNEDYLFDTSLSYHATNGIFGNATRTIITYNPDNFQTATETQSYTGGNYTPGSLFTFARNATNRLTEEDQKTWGGTAYGTNRKTTYQYNAANKQILRLTEDTIGGTANFKPVSKDTSTYDGNNHQQRKEFYSWTNNAWQLSGIFSYLYDAQGREIRMQNRSIYNGVTVGAYDDSTVYNSDGKISETFNQSDTLGNFAYHIRYYYGSTGDNDSNITYFNNGSNAVYIRNLYQYDSQHRLISGEFLLGINSTKQEYTYNSFNQITTELQYSGDGTGNWTLGRQTNLYYETYTDNFSGINSISDGGDIQLYPNPNQGEFQLKINGAEMQNSEVRLYDITGKNVYYGKLNEGSNTIATIGLQKGYYIAIISNSKIAYSQKVVVQ